MTNESMWKSKTFWLHIALTLGTGAASALASSGAFKAYGALRQPALSPPPWVFPIVWTILYLLMAISAFWVSRYATDAHARRAAFWPYGLQLFFNFGWTLLYFTLALRWAAFFWLLVLLALIALMAWRFGRIHRAAGWLQLPYLLWTMFAVYLNLSICLLNG